MRRSIKRGNFNIFEVLNNEIVINYSHYLDIITEGDQFQIRNRSKEKRNRQKTHPKYIGPFKAEKVTDTIVHYSSEKLGKKKAKK